ncbi:MOP flippase family protein [Pseudoalteromonas aliena]|uniref:MOP flippase family protein n=1 Tax=Pseudoalteromonas aliena TaxID=247523 RepID=UPI002494C2FF|nr:MOP flippase family protein [Pseudoalteromonas aliena]
MSVARDALSGVSWTASSTLIKGLLQLVQLIVLARYLTAAELGVLAIVQLVVSFAQIFGDAGISNALIFHKNLVKDQLNQLYIVNVLLGLFISVVVFAMAFPMALFFDMQALTLLLWYLSPVFLIRSFGQQPLALLQQAMRFNSIAKIEVFASVASFTVLIVLLAFDLRLLSVVVSQLLNALLLSGCLLIVFAHLRPKLTRLRIHSIIEPIKYGLYQTGESFVNFISAQLDQLLIGKLLGAEALGIYAYVKALVFRPALQLINPVVNKVAFPLMVNHQHTHSLALLYSMILRLLSLINIPLYSLVALFPNLVLSFTFGEQWLEHAQLLRWLALYMLIISMMNPIGVLLRASGNVKRGFWWNMGVTVARPLIIVFSIESGIVEMVKMLVLLQVVLFVLHWLYLIKPVSGLSAARLCLSLAPAVLAFAMVSLFILVCVQPLLMLSAVYLFAFICVGYVLAIAPQLIKVFKFIRGS